VAVCQAETYLPEKKTLMLEKFKYALESNQQTPVIERFPNPKLFNYNAR